MSVASIYATISGLADFIYEGYRIEVKTFAAETRKPHKRCTLLVKVNDAIDAPCDFYVLWSVNTENVSQRYPLGWATHHALVTSEMGVWSQRTGLLNYGVPRQKLRPLHELKGHVLNLNVMTALSDGREMVTKWDTHHIQAIVSIDGEPFDHVYRGSLDGKVRWFSVFAPDTSWETYRDAVSDCERRAVGEDDGGLRVGAT